MLLLLEKIMKAAGSYNPIIKSMSYTDFLDFQKKSENSSASTFIENYIGDHKDQNLTFEEVLSLALLHMVKQGKVESLKNTLSQYPDFNLLSTVDSNQFSPISYTLTFRQRKNEELKTIAGF